MAILQMTTNYAQGGKWIAWWELWLQTFKTQDVDGKTRLETTSCFGSKHPLCCVCNKVSRVPVKTGEALLRRNISQQWIVR